MDNTQIQVELVRLSEALIALDRLTDAKLVMFRSSLDAQSERVALALSSSDKAVDKAEVATEKRFDGVNEFRAQLSDQAAGFATRENVDLMVTSNRALITDIAERTRKELDDVKAQLTRLMIALLSTLVGTLFAALIYAITR